ACSMKANSLIQTVFYVVAKYGLRRAGDATLTVTVRPRQLRDIGVPNAFSSCAAACSMKANSLIQTVFYVVAKYGLRRAGDATLTV
ncbi:hypothetical protein CKQ90_33180, partial [Klebsiella pneumoniae]